MSLCAPPISAIFTGPFAAEPLYLLASARLGVDSAHTEKGHLGRFGWRRCISVVRRRAGSRRAAPPNLRPDCVLKTSVSLTPKFLVGSRLLIENRRQFSVLLGPIAVFLDEAVPECET